METCIPFRSKVFVDTRDQICAEAMKLLSKETSFTSRPASRTR
jgi:hypothetical protein